MRLDAIMGASDNPSPIQGLLGTRPGCFWACIGAVKNMSGMNIVDIQVRFVLFLILLAIFSRHLASAASWYHGYAYESLTTLHPGPFAPIVWTHVYARQQY